MPSIANHSVLIFGGSSGIGLAAAQLAVDQSARVFISSSNPARISKAIETIHQKFPNASVEGFPCDIKSAEVESNLEKLFTQVIAANNGELLDHIIYCAGDPLPFKALADIDIEFIHSVGQMRFIGPLLVGKLAARFLKQTFSSSYTITSGTIAKKPSASWTVIAAYAAGLESMARNMALELKPIRVNSVLPGPVDTDLWGSVEERKDTLEALQKMSLQGRVASTDDVAESYIYLLRDTNATGSTIVTDGGLLLL